VAALSGQFAFVIKGALTTGVASPDVVEMGSFTADGQGEITSGVMDFVSAGETLLEIPINGGYTLDSDTGVGTLSLGSLKGIQTFALYTTGGGLTPFTSGSLIETDYPSAVVSSGSIYQQSPEYFVARGVFGNWRMSLTGESFVSEGTPAPIFVGGNVFLQHPFISVYMDFTLKVGSGWPEGMTWVLRPGSSDNFYNGRITFGAAGYPNMVAYIIDGLHILVMSTDSPQVFPLVSGTMTRDSFPGQ
jgi:hypothetical protein